MKIGSIVLNSFLIFRGSSRDMDLETKIETYEDLTKDKSSDKYEYIFPSYKFSKRLPSSYNGNYEIVSQGNFKNYNTNIFEINSYPSIYVHQGIYQGSS